MNSHGDVEPCIFTHFAVDNIRQKSLREALRSPFFRAIRSRQPYDANLLRPCMLIDHPTVFREVYAEQHPYPTHQDATLLLTTQKEDIDCYAAAAGQVLDAAWHQTHAAEQAGSEPTPAAAQVAAASMSAGKQEPADRLGRRR